MCCGHTWNSKGALTWMACWRCSACARWPSRWPSPNAAAGKGPCHDWVIRRKRWRCGPATSGVGRWPTAPSGMICSASPSCPGSGAPPPAVSSRGWCGGGTLAPAGSLSRGVMSGKVRRAGKRAGDVCPSHGGPNESLPQTLPASWFFVLQRLSRGRRCGAWPSAWETPMRYLQRALDLAEARGYLRYPEVLALRTQVPDWFRDLGTDAGVVEYEARRGFRVPPALRELYGCPLLACFLEATIDGEVFLTDLATIIDGDLPPIVTW